MYCKKCGTEQKGGQKFCPKCGTPYPSFESEEATPQSPYSEYGEAPHQTYNAPKASTGFQMSLPQIIAIIIGVLAIVGIAIWGINKTSMNSISKIFSSGKPDSSVDGLPFKYSEKGRWGMLRPDGTILFEDEFKDEPTIAHEGRFFVKNGNGLWEIFTAEERPEKIGEEYVSIGNYYDGVAPAVKKNEKISLIDKEGDVITVLERSGSKPITRMENFHYGYALFQAGDAVGIINTKGDILLEARKYCKIYHIAPKRFLAIDMRYKDEIDKNNYIFDIIDQVGNRHGTIRMAKYNDIAVLNDGYFGIEQISDGEKLFGIMDVNGEVIVRPTRKIRGLAGYNDGKFIFSDGEYMGIRTIKDKVLIRPKYDALVWATSDMVWATSIIDERREVVLLDIEGNKLTRESYIDALPFYDGEHAFVQITDNTWSVINNKGEELKNVPDIYFVEHNTPDIVIESDYMDIDAIISAVNMTPNGFGGFGINMSALALIKTYNENCEREEKIEPNPSSVHRDRLSYSKKNVTKGVNFYVELYYDKYITEKGQTHYEKAAGEWIQEPDTWTKEPPQYIKMTISGPKLPGKTGQIYKKLAVKAKIYGQVVKENDHACIIKQKNGQGLILVDNGKEVWGMVKNAENLIHENIEQYSKLKPQISYYDTDSIAEIVDSIIYE